MVVEVEGYIKQLAKTDNGCNSTCFRIVFQILKSVIQISVHVQFDCFVVFFHFQPQKKNTTRFRSSQFLPCPLFGNRTYL